MASLAELARQQTDLTPPQVAHLQRLVASWGLLADFCFADLLLFAPVAGRKGTAFVVLGQIRPTTSQTVYPRDWVGEVVEEAERQPRREGQAGGSALHEGRHDRGHQGGPAGPSGAEAVPAGL